MAEKIKLVVIDDEVDLCVLLKSVLEEKQEFEVTAISNPKDAEQVIRQVMPKVIILDIVMPGRLGTEIIAALKKDPGLKRIPIIVASGKGEFVYEKKSKGFRWLPNNHLATQSRPKIPTARGVESMAEAYGVATYITKPLNSEILIQVIYEVLSAYSGRSDDEMKEGFSDLVE